MTKDNNFNMKAVYGISSTRVNCSMYVLQQKIIKRLKEFKPLIFNDKTKVHGQDIYEEAHEKILNMTDKELIALWEQKSFDPFMKQIDKTPSHYTFYATH